MRGFATKLLVVVLVFQVSVLPDALGIKLTGRVVNAGVLLLLAFLVLLRGRIERRTVILVIPSALIVVAMAQNIVRGLNPSTVGLLSALLPWLAVLTVPFMRSFDLERAWLTFYRFMVVFSIIALVEYAAVNFGVIAPSLIVTDRGLFFKGWMTIFHALDDGTVYYRMYGVFAEPGTFAMFLLPAIAYALVMKKRAVLAPFLACMFFTYSLGGAAGLAVLTLTYSFWRTRRFPLLLIVVMGACWASFKFGSTWFLDQYQAKAMSAVVRENNVLFFLRGFWDIVARDPFGLPLGQLSGSLTSLSVGNSAYIGSNFSPYVAFVMGGLPALFGYLLVVGISILASIKFFLMNEASRLSACAFVSLPALVTFLFQRTTIFESALFAFLYVSPILLAFRRGSRARATVGVIPLSVLGSSESA